MQTEPGTKDAADIPGAALVKALLGVLDRAVDFINFLLLNFIIVIVFAGVIARYVFNSSFSWTEELASWTFVWLIFAGMAAGHRGGRHIASGLFAPKAPVAAAVIRFLIGLIVGYAVVALAIGGKELIDSIGGVSTAMRWPNQIKYWCIPAACAVSCTTLVMADVPARGWRTAILPLCALLLAAAGYIAIDSQHRPVLAGVSPSLIMGICFAVALVIGVPIGFAMLFSVFAANWGAPMLPIPGAVHSMVGGGSSFVLLAIPFFLTAGYLMNSGGLSTRIIDFASALVGHWRGGLAQANVAHSVMLGGTCGSSGADAASTTKILVPEMVRRGYSPPFACAVTAVGSILPACFPPSIAMLIYAAIAEVSVAQLFTAGILPGLLLASLMMVTVYVISKARNYEPAKRRATLAEMFWSGMRALPAFGLALAILFLLRFGVVTATEVGVIAVLWSFVLGKFVYRAFDWRAFYSDMVECSVDSALIGFLIAVSVPFAWILIAEQVPQLIVGGMKTAVADVWMLLLLINALMLLAGMVLEVVPIMLIVVPLFAPTLIQAGIDPIHLGVIIVINSVLGSLTPPVGILVFICASIAKVSAREVFRECWPFVLACGVGLLLITLFPSISLTLWKIIGL